MKYIFKNNLNFFIAITSFHLLFRSLIYLLYLNENEIFFSEDLILALSEDNFYNYLIFQHSIPIGNIFIFKLSLLFAGENNLYLFFYTLNSIYSLSLLLVITKIHYLIFKKNTFLLILMLLAVSISLITYDTWRVDHYDHILIFLFSILTLYFSELFLTNKKFYFNYKFVLLMSLIALFSNLFIIVYLTIIVFFIVLKKKIKINFVGLFYSSVILLFIFSSVLIKNKISINEFTPTSIKGWNFIQRPLYTLGYDKYLDLHQNKLKLSKINQLCVSNIKDKRENFNDSEFFLSLVLHKCFFDNEKQIYDFNKLKKIIALNEIDEPDLERAIKQDIFDIQNNKWKFSGGHEDINLRTTVFFHKQALKIYLSSFINYPFDMIVGTISTEKNQGIIFTFFNMFRWGSQLPYYYEPQHTDIKNNFIKNLQIILSLFIILGLCISLIRSILFIKAFFLKRVTNKEDIFILLLLSICIGYNLTTSFITCCENQRNAVTIFPLIITTSFFSFLLFLKNLNKY